MIERWQVQRIEFMHWQREHGWTWRDVLCRLGLHWPRRWERSAEGDRAGIQELLCEACRYRLDIRPAVLELPERQWTSLAAISGLHRREEEKAREPSNQAS